MKAAATTPELSDEAFEQRVSDLARELYIIGSGSAPTSAPVVPSHGADFDLTVTERLAALSHSLSNSALRVFLHLWARQIRNLSQPMYISTRELSALAGCDPKSTRAALDQLYARGAIVLRWGDSSRPNRIYVSLWEGSVLSFQAAKTTLEGGGKIPPPPRENLPQVGEKFPHPEPEKQGCIFAHAPTRADSDSDSNSDSRSIDLPHEAALRAEEHAPPIVARVLSATPHLFNAQRMYEAAQLLHEAMRRRGERRMQPPDDVVTAQFLACADWPELQRWLLRLIQSHGGRIRRYGYFVAAALEHFHGIKPADLATRREQLRPRLVQVPARALAPLTSPPPPPPPPPPIAPPAPEEDNLHGLSELDYCAWQQIQKDISVSPEEYLKALELRKVRPPQDYPAWLRLIEEAKNS